MELFLSPLACSMATRIALTEANLAADFIEVDPLTKRTQDGRDFRTINPIGFVPVLRTESGETIRENFAVLTHVAATAQQLAPADEPGQTRCHQWLGFIGTELHKVVFSPFFDPEANEAVRDYAANKSVSRLRVLDEHLQGREFLLDAFSVADAYLITILNWAQATPIDLSHYPAISAYMTKALKRPAVRAAIEHEMPLYIAERDRAKKAIHATPAPA